jgi:MFS family permease
MFGEPEHAGGAMLLDPLAVKRRGLVPRAAPPWVTLVVCCVGQFMVILDVTIVNVALPQMRHDLGLSVSGQEWVVNAYTLAFAGFLMLGGRAADLWGRRRLFLIGITVFTAASHLGGLAVGGPWLITARAVQGQLSSTGCGADPPGLRGAGRRSGARPCRWARG